VRLEARQRDKDKCSSVLKATSVCGLKLLVYEALRPVRRLEARQRRGAAACLARVRGLDRPHAALHPSASVSIRACVMCQYLYSCTIKASKMSRGKCKYNTCEDTG
jgi:hypothetical protein